MTDQETRFFQGETTSAPFSGEGRSTTIQQAYGESAKLFSEIITNRVKDKDVEHSFADFGCHKGELLKNVLDLLKDYRFYTVGVDVAANLQDNTVATEKVPCNLTNIPLESKSVEFGMMRYVLQWNTITEQEKILNEVLRVVSDFVIVQHVGPGNESPDSWRERLDELFTGVQVPKMKRDKGFMSSEGEIERIFVNNEIKYEKIDSKRLENLSNIFIERFNLSEDESVTVRNILADKDYMIRTTWVIETGK